MGKIWTIVHHCMTCQHTLITPIIRTTHTILTWVLEVVLEVLVLRVKDL